MSGQLFRKSSIERISSPEQLNDYVRVSTPGVWMTLGAIVILLAGVCVWGVFGRLDTKLATAGVCKDGVLTCYVREGDIGEVEEGMEIEVSGEASSISGIQKAPVAVSQEMDPYLLHLGDFQSGEWVYAVTADVPVSDGTYEASITTESVSPMSFIWN